MAVELFAYWSIKLSKERIPDWSGLYFVLGVALTLGQAVTNVWKFLWWFRPGSRCRWHRQYSNNSSSLTATWMYGSTPLWTQLMKLCSHLSGWPESSTPDKLTHLYPKSDPAANLMGKVTARFGSTLWLDTSTYLCFTGIPSCSSSLGSQKVNQLYQAI